MTNDNRDHLTEEKAKAEITRTLEEVAKSRKLTDEMEAKLLADPVFGEAAKSLIQQRNYLLTHMELIGTHAGARVPMPESAEAFLRGWKERGEA